ncbi:MAG TPA: 4'-phosphopantetheinyl transferase superfamily protein [bacterium]|nr:4'-phosphopantetheinyl transferase superfamily protein [bacterium]HPJ71309.1 4'-phosphopantetheinyl transferase superfamily protein [bacterium]HPQ65433.1 4'-phosphopantetheinyl transferase superfamily protein [bacterium]
MSAAPGTGNVVKVRIVNLASLESDLERLRGLLGPGERRRADSCSHRRVRDDFIVSRALLRLLLGRELGVSPGDLNFAYNEEGKPYLRENPVFFNLSHSGRMVAYAVSPAVSVGIDIEEIRPSVDYRALIERWWSSGEKKWVAGFATEASRRESFFRLWTRKEAYAKVRGVSVYRVLSTEVGLPGQTSARERGQFLFWEPPLGEGWAGTVVAAGANARLDYAALPADVFHQYD